jgi:2-polyprenyl-3-methyl-5-hydroxy-6-metoxy-1,4-benzoquinol methylase
MSNGEEQYKEFIEYVKNVGYEKLGYMSSWAWHDDPKRLAFTTSRYKFVSKMLSGSKRVLEVGCGDGFGSRIVAGEVDSLVCIDFDSKFIESAKQVASKKFSVEFYVHDILKSAFEGAFDGIYSLDVLEHINTNHEEIFMSNIKSSLIEGGVFIVGCPSLESQEYASKYSKMGHVNCKSQVDLKVFLKKYFKNVFMFSMNDEVIHTGFSKMSHYNIGVCC